MSERNLARFRADPSKVRVALRPNGDLWDVLLESHIDSWSFAATSVPAKAIPKAVMDLLFIAYKAKAEGIDPHMDWAYEHPQNVRQYEDLERIEQDNEMLRSIGMAEEVNEIH